MFVERWFTLNSAIKSMALPVKCLADCMSEFAIIVQGLACVYFSGRVSISRDNAGFVIATDFVLSFVMAHLRLNIFIKHVHTLAL